MAVPDKLVNFRCYDEGENMLGIVDVTLPNLAYMSEDMMGAGIAGNIDSPVIGHFQSLTTTINWRSTIDENIIYSAPKTYHFDFRGSIQTYEEGSGDYTERPIKAVMRVKPKNVNLGNLNVASQMGTSGEFEVIYLKVSISGSEYVEIDKLAMICIIDGVDYLAQTRANIGM